MVKILNAQSELQLQKLVVDITKEHGGFGVKLAHRHLVGVPDLFVQLPNKPAVFFEAKQVSFRQVRRVSLAVTGPQFNFLKNAAIAGMRCGVIAFLQTPNAFGVQCIDIRAHNEHSTIEAIPEAARWGAAKDRRTLVWMAMQDFYHLI